MLRPRDMTAAFTGSRDRGWQQANMPWPATRVHCVRPGCGPSTVRSSLSRPCS